MGGRGEFVEDVFEEVSFSELKVQGDGQVYRLGLLDLDPSLPPVYATLALAVRLMCLPEQQKRLEALLPVLEMFAGLRVWQP